MIDEWSQSCTLPLNAALGEFFLGKVSGLDIHIFAKVQFSTMDQSYSRLSAVLHGSWQVTLTQLNKEMR